MDPEGIYFVSFATVGWVDVFTRTEYKDLVIESLKYCQQHKGMVIHAWCLMTNHIHLIFSCEEAGQHANIIRDLKKFTSTRIFKEILSNPQESRKQWMMKIFREAGEQNSNNSEIQFWQQNNHPIEIYSPDVICQKLMYVHNNPVASGIVLEPEYFLYSSARDYLGHKGLVNVKILEIPLNPIGYIHIG